MSKAARVAAFGLVVAAIGFFFALLALAVVDREQDLLQAAVTVAPWAGGLAAIVLAALTWMYVSATQAMAKATAELAEETRRQREESTAPRVTVHFDFLRSWLLHVSLENIGRGVARNVRVTFSPHIPSRAGAIPRLPVSAETIPILRPGEKFSHFVDSTPSFFSTERNNPRQYLARVSYQDLEGNAVEPEDFPLDLSVYEGMAVFEEKGLNDLVKEVEEIRRVVGRITDLSSLHIKTPRDIEREHREWLKRVEERRAQEAESHPEEERQNPEP
jgi:hypothetical protein